jgi:NAD dependent epimerase/dehydratase family enzyme
MPNVPAFVLKILFGELANAILEGSRASSQKLQNAGFQFKFPDLYEALNSLLNKER